MSTKKDDGGPAFPTPIGGGMSLRDWFAGQALAGLFATGPGSHLVPEDAAKAAYRYADAMLAERSK